MRVEDLMTKQVHCSRPQDSLERAAQLMWEHDCGCLPVCSADAGATRHVLGMITDRDICMAALFQGRPLRELMVTDAMAREPLHCAPGDSLEHAEKVMRGGRVRRLPVLDERGELLGVLSLADLAREAARESPMVHKDLTETEIGDTLAAICSPSVAALAA